MALISRIRTFFANKPNATATALRTSVLIQGFDTAARREAAHVTVQPDNLAAALRNIATGIKLAYVAKAGAYTMTENDCIVGVSAAAAARTITLPAAASHTGRVFSVLVTDSTNDVTVDGNGSETIGGSATQVLTAVSDFIVIISDGTNWQIIASKITP